MNRQNKSPRVCVQFTDSVSDTLSLNTLYKLQGCLESILIQV